MHTYICKVSFGKLAVTVETDIKKTADDRKQKYAQKDKNLPLPCYFTANST